MSTSTLMTSTAQRADVAPIVAIFSLLLGAGLGFTVGKASPEPFEARVIAISQDGDNLCIDRAENSCGQPVIHPEDRDKVTRGALVLLTEVWVQVAAGDRLVFVVELPDDA